ncbi:hypothetical protein [Paenibacillus sp. RUD330]|uniref:hypothetical protein n=1 Tax=Paenibacillus sp. RUD330 TaxID=2023772 RepID=UPI0012FDB026|nr:hypothetical protein [Paenibacillus sp. RUD330]ASS66246.2 hypothetical protein CIC07_08845 [Paenibacillus sp. RUD330]
MKLITYRLRQAIEKFHRLRSPAAKRKHAYLYFWRDAEATVAEMGYPSALSRANLSFKYNFSLEEREQIAVRFFEQDAQAVLDEMMKRMEEEE